MSISCGPQSYTSSVAKGFGVNVGIAKGIFTNASIVSFRDRDLSGRIVLVSDPADFRPVVKANPSAVVATFGGPLSHSATWSVGERAKIGLGFRSENLSLLKEGQSVTLSNGPFDDAHLLRGSHDYPIIAPPVRSFMRPIWMNTCNVQAALQAAALPIAGLGIVRFEYILDEAEYELGELRGSSCTDYHDQVSRYCMIIANAERQERFRQFISARLSALAQALWPRPIYVRLPDLILPHGGVDIRGTRALLQDTCREFTVFCISLLHKVHERLPNTRMLIPYPQNLNQLEEVQLLCSDCGWHYPLGMMVENSSIVRDIPLLRGGRVDGLVIGLGDLTSELLRINRDQMFDLFTHVRFENVLKIVDEVLEAGCHHDLPVYIGGFPSSWLWNLQDALQGSPDGWFLRGDPRQISWLLGEDEYEV